MILKLKNNCYILNHNIGVSYQTPQAICIGKILYITENYYSRTTAKHKQLIKDYFRPIETIEVKHNTLIDLINGELPAEAVITEYQDKQTILKNLAESESGFIKNKNLVNEYIVTAGLPETTQYKNGNRKTIYYKAAIFRYIPSIQYKHTVKHIKTKVKSGYYRSGYKPDRTTNKTTYKVVVTSL